MNFVITFNSGANEGRSFIIENVRNKADAINEAFKRVTLHINEDYVNLSCTEIPVNKNPTETFDAQIQKDCD